MKRKSLGRVRTSGWSQSATEKGSRDQGIYSELVFNPYLLGTENFSQKSVTKSLVENQQNNSGDRDRTENPGHVVFG